MYVVKGILTGVEKTGKISHFSKIVKGVTMRVWQGFAAFCRGMGEGSIASRAKILSLQKSNLMRAETRVFGRTQIVKRVFWE